MKKTMIAVSIFAALSLGFGYYGQKDYEAAKSNKPQDSSVVGSADSGATFGDKGEVIKTVQYVPPAQSGQGMSREQEDFKKEAVLKIQVASKLVLDAQNMVRANPTKDTLMAAMNIFAQAGQMFEQSSRMLKLLGPQYVNPSDLEGCENAVKGCLNAIKLCRERVVAILQQENARGGARR